MARQVQLPGAHTPPGPDLPRHELLAPAEARPATADAPAETTPAAPDDGPGSPAWEALAASPAVRAWAISEGWDAPAGRLPGAIVLAYRKTHPHPNGVAS
jgi:hypothetical protein